MGRYFRIVAPFALAAMTSASLVVALPASARANMSRSCAPGPGLDLAGCDYSGVDVVGADFSGSNLRRANFSNANLNDTNFTNADLRHANLSGAGMVFDCASVACPFSSLDGSNLTFAVNPNFTNADLHAANLTRAAFAGTQEVTEVCFGLPRHCITVNGIYPDTIFAGVRSGGIIGSASSLPSGWELIDGYLTVPPPPLLITSMSNLPPATNGAPYSTVLTATGGVQPYKWNIASGMLPRGLHLQPTSGMISGTPRASELSMFTVEVTDTRTHQPTTQRTQTLRVSLQVT